MIYETGTREQARDLRLLMRVIRGAAAHAFHGQECSAVFDSADDMLDQIIRELPNE